MHRSAAKSPWGNNEESTSSLASQGGGPRLPWKEKSGKRIALRIVGGQGRMHEREESSAYRRAPPPQEGRSVRGMTRTKSQGGPSGGEKRSHQKSLRSFAGGKRGDRLHRERQIRQKGGRRRKKLRHPRPRMGKSHPRAERGKSFSALRGPFSPRETSPMGGRVEAYTEGMGKKSLPVCLVEDRSNHDRGERKKGLCKYQQGSRGWKMPP